MNGNALEERIHLAIDLFPDELNSTETLLIDLNAEFIHRSFETVNFLPLLHYVCETTNIKWVKNFIQKVKNVIWPKIREHERTINMSHVRDFTDALILSRADIPDEQKKLLSDNHLFHILKNISLAGTETTRHTLSVIYMIDSIILILCKTITCYLYIYNQRGVTLINIYFIFILLEFIV